MASVSKKIDKSHLTPEQIVAELNSHVIGQLEAKRALASALRNRWRRQKVEMKLRSEITPRNVLMIGPTGVGKTELARRIATLAEAPFIKVEATKFTEVGYVGRDVESMVRDLVDASIKMTRELEMAKFKNEAETAAENRILDILLPSSKKTDPHLEQEEDSAARAVFRKKLRSGQLDDKEIEIDVASGMGVEIMAPPGMEEMTSQLQSMFQHLSSDKKRAKKMKIGAALKLLKEEEAAKFIHEDDLKAMAVENAEQNGIIFIDEIDKIASRGNRGGGADVSREGVQRDLLPLIEGCNVNTKYGMIKTDHILFVASGAFHLSRPSDLIPELQGRLPIRVELKALTVDDFKRILTEPNASLTIQYKALLATEGVDLQFSDEALLEIAKIAWQVNETTENIGARRLHTVMERLLEELSYDATRFKNQRVLIDAEYVKKHLGNLAQDEDLSHYIL